MIPLLRWTRTSPSATSPGADWALATAHIQLLFPCSRPSLSNVQSRWIALLLIALAQVYLNGTTRRIVDAKAGTNSFRTIGICYLLSSIARLQYGRCWSRTIRRPTGARMEARRRLVRSFNSQALRGSTSLPRSNNCQSCRVRKWRKQSSALV
jgi:hypothetical protein